MKIILLFLAAWPLFAQHGAPPSPGSPITNIIVEADPSGNCSNYNQQQTNVIVTPPSVWTCVNTAPLVNQFGTWTQSNASGSDPTLDQVLNPTAGKSFAMGSNFLTFTFGATTTAGNMLNVLDTAANTGTGYVATIGTASGSAANPLQVLCGGAQCASMAASSQLWTVGNATDFLTMGPLPGGGYAGLWGKQGSPGSTNYALLTNQNDTYFNALVGVHFKIANGGADLATITSAGFSAISVQLTGGAQGTCDVTTHGKQQFVPGGTGVADQQFVCAKNAADAYVWVTLF